MVLWVAAAGTLIGLLLAWNGSIGFVLGGIFGALMGRWLRHELRREIRAEVARMQLAEAIPAAVAESWDGQAATPVERAAEPVQSEPAPPPLEAVSAPEAAQPLVQATEPAVREPADPQEQPRFFQPGDILEANARVDALPLARIESPAAPVIALGVEPGDNPFAPRKLALWGRWRWPPWSSRWGPCGCSRPTCRANRSDQASCEKLASAASFRPRQTRAAWTVSGTS
jgi:hypothetical protein